MLTLLLCAIVYPLVVGNSRYAALRGGLIGLLLSLGISYFVPKTTERETAFSPMRLEKQMTTDGSVSQVFTALVINDQKQIKTYQCPADKTTITIGDGVSPVFFVCHNKVVNPWMNLFTIPLPLESYEIEVPRSMVNACVATAKPEKETLYENKIENINIAAAK